MCVCVTFSTIRWHCVPLPAAGAPAIMMCRGVPAVLTPLCTSKDACKVIYIYRTLLGTQSQQAVLQGSSSRG